MVKKKIFVQKNLWGFWTKKILAKKNVFGQKKNARTHTRTHARVRTRACVHACKLHFKMSSKDLDEGIVTYNS